METARLRTRIWLMGISFVALAGCGGGGGHSGGGGGPIGPTPVISNLNGSTAPASPTNVSLEVNGTGFGSSPGKVRFLPSGSTTPTDVAPIASAWSDTNIVVTVPGSIAAPSSVAVSVVGADGIVSAPVSLSVTATPSFSPSSIQWTTTTALPLPRTGHAAVAVPAGTASGWLYVIGGNEGTADVTSVLVASLDANGNAGAWRPTNPLPASRAFLATAEADPTSSPVSLGSAFIYAIGGQAAATDTPGGTSTVFVGSVNLGTGDVTWSATSSLPETRVGARAAVANGFLHVTGGDDGTGRPIAATASAPIGSGGQLGAFTENSTTSNLPQPVAYHSTFAFGGFLYVIDGDQGIVANPSAGTTTSPTSVVWFAPIRHGVVGGWSGTSGAIKPRAKHALLFAFGQVMVYEGLYGNTNFEAERSSVNADGTLASWGGLTGGSIPGLNTFDTWGVTSPILTSTQSPRFLLIGGQQVSAPATLVSTVARTSAP